MNQNPKNKENEFEIEFEIEDLSIEPSSVEVDVKPSQTTSTSASDNVSESSSQPINTSNGTDSSLSTDDLAENISESTTDSSPSLGNDESTDSNGDLNEPTDGTPEERKSLKQRAQDTKDNFREKADQIKNAPENIKNKYNEAKDKAKDIKDKAKQVPENLRNKKDQVKNAWNNRPKSMKDVKERMKGSNVKDKIKNGAKNRAKNVANKAKDGAKDGFNNSKLGQTIDKGKNAIDKGKKVAKGAKKAGKAAVKAGKAAGKAAAKAAQGLLNLFISTLPWSAIVVGVVLAIVLIILLVCVLVPGVGGDVNDEDNYSKYSEVDQKTLTKLKKLFAEYPNADGTLAMATVIYPYFDNIHDGNVTSILQSSSNYVQDDEEESDEVTEIDEDNEDIEDDESDTTEDDPYLVIFRSSKIRRKLKRILKELNNSNQDGYRKYLTNTYFLEDKGYGGFDENILTGYNGYKEMFDSIKEEERDALAEAIIEDLDEKKSWFVDYVYENLSCSVSFQSAGTVEIDELLKSNILIDVKVESCKTGKNVQDCESKYSSPITLDKYVMSVTYEEIGVNANSDIEKVKAQMVAAKSFVLSRWKSMGWEISKMEDGSYVIPIRSNTNDQDFCDIDNGCLDKLSGAKRPPIDEATRAIMINAWDETKNLFIYDNDSQKTSGSYCANRSDICDFCQKGTCLSHEELSDYKSGTIYTTILGEQYSSLSLITLEGDFASVAVPGNVTCTSGALGSGGVPDELFTYYYQTDYPNVAFCGATDWVEGCYSDPAGKNTICTSGCGVTSLAMIVSTLSDEKFDPIMANNEAYAYGYCAPGSGSNNSLFTNVSNNHNGFEVKNVEVSRSGADDIITALKNGALVAANVQSQSPFTSGGHWIVIRGIASNGEVKVADPFSKEKTTSSTYNIYDFIDNNWLVDQNGNVHNWYIIYGPKSSSFATKISSTGDPGVATGYLGNPTDPNNTTRSYANDGNSKTFPKYSGGTCHGGVDLSMNVGTSIYAMDGGVVSEVGDYSGNCNKNKSVCNRGWNSYGIYVVIDHQNGYKSVYAHFSQRVVNVGDVISKGQLIGYSGNSGNSTGPHLHLELQNIELLNANGRDTAKCSIGKGLINPTLYINSETTYVGQTN